MTLQLPDPHASLNEPKRSAPPMSHGSTAQPEDSDARMEKAWLREQLLAGKHSPLCDPRAIVKSSVQQASQATF